MAITPNIFAYLMLLASPLAAIFLFKKLPAGKAAIWTILGAYLILPVGLQIKFAMIPAFDKSSIPNLVAFIACVVVLRRPIRVFNGFGIAEFLIAVTLLGPLVTSLLNQDSTSSGGLDLPGVGYYDGGSAVIAQFIALIPFFIGRQVLRDDYYPEYLLRTLAVAGLVYSVPILFEIRMSPQLHTWLYGYFPHEMFGQQMRDGGFRPVVFLGHGLIVALFMATSAIAATALWRARVRVTQLPPGAVAAYLGGILVLCKSLGSLLYGFFALPLVRWASPKTQVRAALVLVSIAVAYPMLKTAGLVPTNTILGIAKSISVERAASLETRLTNEERLLARASERFWFGWGRYGRSRVYDKWGNDITLSDEFWTTVMGEYGFVGFLARFGLLAFPIFRVWSAFKFVTTRNHKIYLAALTLICAVNVFDLLPNASIRPWTWLLMGSLVGYAEMLQATARQGIKITDAAIQTGRQAS